MPIPTQFNIFYNNPNCPIEYHESEWSTCSSTCGQGIQTQMSSHVCANVPGTWVDPSKFIQQRTRACSTPCCIRGEPGPWIGQPQECVEWRQRRERRNEDISGGCSMSNPPINIIEYEESEVYPPTLLAEQWYPNWGYNNNGWTGCVPQPSTRISGLVTTCGLNGLRTRQQCHPC